MGRGAFRRPRQVSFLRLARVRLAAEAFSYLTLRGIAGEPLKVVLLDDRVDAREATAAVALERLAYMIGTTLIVGVGSLIAIARPAADAGCGSGSSAPSRSRPRSCALLAAVVITGRGTYVQALFTALRPPLGHVDRGRTGGALHLRRSSARCSIWCAATRSGSWCS